MLKTLPPPLGTLQAIEARHTGRRNMAHWNIKDTIGGVVLGVYDGETASEALDAMARDAGYEDYDSITGDDGTIDDRGIVVTEVEE